MLRAGERSILHPACSRDALAILALVVGTFFFGWLLGVAVVFKLWQLAHAPRWLVFSGMGSVSFLMAPIIMRRARLARSAGWRRAAGVARRSG